MENDSADIPPIEIYSSIFCPYCHKAMGMLRRSGFSFRKIEIPMILGWKPPTRQFKEMVRRSGGERTVPQIFINGAYFGDDDTLKACVNDGKLENLISRAPQ